jgi:hypothetical protein
VTTAYVLERGLFVGKWLDYTYKLGFALHLFRGLGTPNNLAVVLPQPAFRINRVTHIRAPGPKQQIARVHTRRSAIALNTTIIIADISFAAVTNSTAIVAINVVSAAIAIAAAVLDVIAAAIVFAIVETVSAVNSAAITTASIAAITAVFFFVVASVAVVGVGAVMVIAIFCFSIASAAVVGVVTWGVLIVIVAFIIRLVSRSNGRRKPK